MLPDFDRYWQLGLNALLQGDVLEAQGIWLSLLTETDRPDEITLELIDRLEQTAKQSLSQETLELIYRQILELDPDRESAYRGLMNMLFQQGKLEEAIECCNYLLALYPDNPDLYNNLGVLLESQGRLDEAISCYQKGIEINPQHANSYYNLGYFCQQQGNFQEAIDYYQKSLNLDEKHIPAYYNLALLYEQQDDWDRAIACYQALISLEQNPSRAYNYLGYLFHQKGYFTEARNAFDRALELDPTDAEAHFNRSLLLLQLGEFEQGWQEFEWRWKLSDRATYANSQKLWDGSDLQGKTILLYAEYGFGDTIQFIRYVPLVAQRGGRVIVQIPPDLIPLVQSVPGITMLLSNQLNPPTFDVQAPLMSLPRILGTTIDTIPAPTSYLSAPKKNRFTAPDSTFKVGIAWAGNPQYRRDRSRSCSLTHFLPILQIPNISFFSLQKGARVTDLADLPEGLNVQDWGSQFNDFAETAEAIDQLDLVITTDTAIAHLAGALGKPTWLLLSYVPDWRWLLDPCGICEAARSNSHWYPSMRLFRQAQPNDWSGVFAEVAIALQSLISSI